MVVTDASLSVERSMFQEVLPIPGSHIQSSFMRGKASAAFSILSPSGSAISVPLSQSRLLIFHQ